MKKLVTFLATGIFFTGIIGTVGATPIVNIAGDGFEDYTDNVVNGGGKTLHATGEAYAYYANSGEFMFLEQGNNEGVTFSSGAVETFVESWLIAQAILTESDRSTFNLTESSSTVAYQGVDLTGTTIADPTKAASGTWSVAPIGDTINFYAVKTSTAYAMYYVSPAAGMGSWSTYAQYSAGLGGNDPIEISHFTGYNSASTPVPEPATMLLFGTGLVGLVGVARRKKK